MYLLAEGGLRKDRQHKEVDLFCAMFVFENESKKLVLVFKGYGRALCYNNMQKIVV